MPRIIDTIDRLTGRRRSIALGLTGLVAIGASAVVAALTTGSTAVIAVFLALTVVATPGLLAVKMVFERGQRDRVRDEQFSLLNRRLGELRADVSAARGELDRVGGKLDRLGDQFDQLREQAGRTQGLATKLSHDADLMRVAGDEFRERIDHEWSVVDGRVSGFEGRVSGLIVSVDTLREQQSAATIQRDAHEKRLELLNERARINASRIQVERQARTARHAEKRSSGRFPSRLVIQMTLARSGSTRLFDIMRCHPDVFMEPSNEPWKELGLSGRRYPVGLSDIPGAATPVVALDDVGALIRGMRTDDPESVDPPTGSVAVEKAHPVFFDFRVDAFLDFVAAAEKRHGATVDFVYQVRSPLEVMWSMAEYKAREPGWHGSLTIEDIPMLVLRSLESLDDLRTRRPGLIVDYSDVYIGSPIMTDVGTLIAQGVPSDNHFDWLPRAFDRTSRERLGEKTAFVGERSDRTLAGPDGAWIDQKDVLRRATSTYEKTLGSRRPVIELPSELPASAKRVRDQGTDPDRRIDD